ncbi:hypothetical protein LEP1GSC076_3251 [Leptospira sp. Fiocruz LV4135]|nr:hypothetical protein LEP1GSC076_3251 [Leptospira sp. Fiocruz LV4135]
MSRLSFESRFFLKSTSSIFPGLDRLHLSFFYLSKSGSERRTGKPIPLKWKKPKNYGSV